MCRSQKLKTGKRSDSKNSSASASTKLDLPRYRSGTYRPLLSFEVPVQRTVNSLVANRLALEAWPLFPCFPNRDKIATRGFTGTGMFNTFWTWPLWTAEWTSDTIASALALPELQAKSICNATVRARGIGAVLRCQRILVGKTPNLTQAKVIG